MDSDYKKYMDVAKDAALSAGKYLADNFGKNHVANLKTENDVGIVEDIESESIILNIIKGKYPKHNFFSEEIGEIKNNSKFKWFIDPLDGTNNYFAGIPYFSVSISLLFENEIIIGVVYNPISNQFFEATKNGGALLNGVPILPSKNSDFNKSVCSFVQGHNVSTSIGVKSESVRIKNKLEQNFRRVISTWAPALDWALLASGGIEALISFDSELEDMYAGLLIAKETGIKIANFNKNNFQIGDKRIIASNYFLHSDLVELLS